MRNQSECAYLVGEKCGLLIFFISGFTVHIYCTVLYGSAIMLSYCTLTVARPVPV